MFPIENKKKKRLRSHRVKVSLLLDKITYDGGVIFFFFKKKNKMLQEQDLGIKIF
jgi:hypothetical protein